jgi:predicted DNA-binding transcriptional regulator AlpA
MDRLLTPEALSAMLGMSVQTVYNRRSQGLPLPRAVKLGRLLRFRESDVETWLDRQVEDAPVPLAVQPARRGRPTKAEQVARRGK